MVKISQNFVAFSEYMNFRGEWSYDVHNFIYRSNLGGIYILIFEIELSMERRLRNFLALHLN
jgi:hypothetical protein